MKLKHIVPAVLLSSLVAAAPCLAQMLPELNFPLSARDNAMGGAGVSYESYNSFAIIENPAALGLASLNQFFTAGFVPATRTSYVFPYPYSSESKLTQAFGFSAGTTLNRFLTGLPLRVSFGLAYSNIGYRFLLPGFDPYDFLQSDVINRLTLAAAFNYVVTFGFGYSFVPLNYKLQDFGSAATITQQTVDSHDFGAIFRVPALKLLSTLQERGTFTAEGVEPILDLTIGYSQRNIGNEYDSFGSAGLPREAALGWNIVLGFNSRVDNHKWKWFSFTWVRESGAALLTLDSSVYIDPHSYDTTYSYVNRYESGLGSFRIYDNLIAGKSTGEVNVLKGWQVQIGQIFYLRGGSVTDVRRPTYTTFGWGANSAGIVKALLFLRMLNPGAGITNFLLDHLDLRFDYSRAEGGPFANEPLETLTLVMR